MKLHAFSLLAIMPVSTVRNTKSDVKIAILSPDDVTSHLNTTLYIIFTSLKEYHFATTVQNFQKLSWQI